MLKEVITANMLQGVFDEIVSIIPVVIPVVLGYVGVRKAISFMMGMLHSA